MIKNICLKSIKDDHPDGYTSGSGLIRSILGNLELPSQKNHTFMTIWESLFSYEPPLFMQKGPRARNDYDEETAYESYMNPEPGFQSGPGDSVDAD